MTHYDMKCAMRMSACYLALNIIHLLFVRHMSQHTFYRRHVEIEGVKFLYVMRLLVFEQFQNGESYILVSLFVLSCSLFLFYAHVTLSASLRPCLSEVVEQLLAAANLFALGVCHHSLKALLSQFLSPVIHFHRDDNLLEVNAALRIFDVWYALAGYEMYDMLSAQGLQYFMSLLVIHTALLCDKRLFDIGIIGEHAAVVSECCHNAFSSSVMSFRR